MSVHDLLELALDFPALLILDLGEVLVPEVDLDTPVQDLRGVRSLIYKIF